LGADEFVDIEQHGWQDSVEKTDMVFDTMGGNVLARAQLGRRRPSTAHTDFNFDLGFSHTEEQAFWIRRHDEYESE
jgi:hypothetical protein